MYKVLIADDELWLRKRLMATLPWEELGIGEVLEAEDGAEALMLAIKHEPDIIISDIEMPELTGIDLLHTLNASALYPKVILISGYNEFEYARNALKYGAIDYLLKPIDDTELVAILKKCVSTLNQDQIEKDVLDRLSHSSHLLQDRLFLDIIEGKIDPSGQMSRYLEDGGFSFSHKNGLCVCVVPQADPEHLLPSSAADRTLEEFTAQNVLMDLFKTTFGGVYSYSLEGLLLFVLFDDRAEGEFLSALRECFARAQEKVQEVLPIRLAVSIGTVVQKLADLHKSYLATQYRTELPLGEPKESRSVPQENYGVIYQNDLLLKTLVQRIMAADRTGALSQLDGILDMFRENLGTDRDASHLQQELFFINIFNYILKACLPAQGEHLDILHECVNCLAGINSIHTLDKAKELLAALIDTLCKSNENILGNKKHWLIERIVSYIHEEYASPLTMSDVAKKFYLNPSYFCKLFRDETGITFTNYLMDVRIQQSKKLLEETNLKLYDVASSVGYSNVQYFSTVFKEITGIPPSQYRATHNNHMDQ